MPGSVRVPSSPTGGEDGYWIGKLIVAAGGYAIGASVVTLVGWGADMPRLTDWEGNGISMLPNPAVAAAAAGGALLLISYGLRTAGAIFGLFAGLIGAATLVQHLSGIDLGIDRMLLYRDWGQSATLAPGRMGPPASTSLMIAGGSLVLTTLGRRARRAAAAGGLVVVGIAMLSILGYLFGSDTLYSIPHLTAIALQTSTILLALGVGLVLSAGDVEPMRTLRGDSAGARLVRRVLPFVLLVPIAVGWLRLQGERLGLFDSAFGTALRTLVEVVLLTGLLWWTAASVRKHALALRRSEAELRRQSGQLAAFLETAAVGLHRVGPDGTIMWANESELRTLGYAPEEYIGRPIAEFHADREVIEDILARLHRGETVRNREARMKCRDGSLKTVLIDSSVLWENGEFIHTQCFTRDITGQKRAEEAVRESERRFREMIDALPAAVYTTDAGGRLTYFNSAAVEFSGRVPELGTDRWCVSWKLYSPDGTPLAPDACPMAIALKEGRTVRGAEALAERPDGTRVWFQPFSTPLRDAEGRVVGGINMLVDITDRKRAEAAAAKLAAIVESSDDAIVGKGLDGIIHSWNGGAARIFGYTAEEAVGRHITLIIPPERRPEEEEVLARLRRGEKIDHFETERLAKDGRRVNISLTVSPVKDSAGRIIGASKVARDITDRKASEALLAAHQQQLESLVEERTRELVTAHNRLRMTDRMAAVGTLAAGLAHDMKNVLMPLGIRLDAILTTPGLTRDASADLAVVCALLDHLRAMANNLSLFARDPEQEGTEGQTDPARWCGQVRGFIDASAGSAVIIRWDVPEGLPAVKIAPHRLTQAVLNLVHNARDAIASARGPLVGMPGNGRITVEARARAADGPEKARLVVTVRDNGCGMSEEVLQRCREPFFTTKDRPITPGAQGGTGLGLSMAHAIVERVGGTMEIESERGAGTTVTLNLPLLGTEQPEHESPPAPGRARVSIEDKRARAIVGHVLGALRYEVLDADSGELPEGTLWVIDGQGVTPDEAAAFIRRGPGRRVVALCGGGQDGEDDTRDRAWREAGAEVCSRGVPVQHLRAVLAGRASADGPGL